MPTSRPPKEKPAGRPRKAYVEPFAVGKPLADRPLFLTPEWYVNVPLEATDQSAWRGVPRRWRDVLQGPRSERPDKAASGPRCGPGQPNDPRDLWSAQRTLQRSTARTGALRFRPARRPP